MTTSPPEWLDARGAGDQTIWGMTARERVARLAQAQDRAGNAPVAGHVLSVNQDFVFDPILMKLALAQPGTRFEYDNIFVIAQTPADATPPAPAAAIVDLATGPTVYNETLRKLETPFAVRLTPATRRSAERALYDASYKGVTDLLTKYLWPEWAFVLTRLAARIGMTPNMVTAIGAGLCIAATFAFAAGLYWEGIAMGLAFMVLDTVDGKLARCTVTSSHWGNIFDHGIDLVHPPFWWWAWAAGLGAWGLAYDRGTFAVVIGVIVIGYVAQRLIEGIAIKWLGIELHVWQRFDSRFRLITARRNPNMAILFVALLFGRPDLGLIAVAGWTLISLVVHAVRLAQGLAAQRSAPIRSWMEKP